MIAFLTAVLLSIVPHTADAVLVDRVDLIELNHYHDDCGIFRYSQVIAWDWHSPHGCHHVAGIRLFLRGQPPHRCYATGQWRDAWQGKSGDSRVVLARTFRETWTQYDPELDDRETWPKMRRRFGPSQW